MKYEVTVNIKRQQQTENGYKVTYKGEILEIQTSAFMFIVDSLKDIHLKINEEEAENIIIKTFKPYYERSLH